jgi:spore maturation protein SpmB
MQGSAETVFYVVAVYFGSVSIRNTRYSIPAMLLAELVSVLSSIGLAYLFFGK